MCASLLYIVLINDTDIGVVYKLLKVTDDANIVAVV